MTRDFLTKVADTLSGVESDRIPMSTPTSMSLGVLPKSDSQLKWNYWLAQNAAQDGQEAGNTLRLANGPTSIMFKLPKDFAGAAQQLGDEDSLPENAVSGTAQIHRSSPDAIYFTMQDGKENRTVLLTKSDDGTWEAKVKPKKFSVKTSSDLKELVDWIPTTKRAFGSYTDYEDDMLTPPYLDYDPNRSALADRPEYQQVLQARELLSGPAGAPLRMMGTVMARSPAGSAALGGVLGGVFGAPAGALLSQLGYEKRVGPADNAIRLGAVGSAIGALIAGLGSASVRNAANQYQQEQSQGDSKMAGVKEAVRGEYINSLVRAAGALSHGFPNSKVLNPSWDAIVSMRRNPESLSRNLALAAPHTHLEYKWHLVEAIKKLFKARHELPQYKHSLPSRRSVEKMTLSEGARSLRNAEETFLKNYPGAKDIPKVPARAGSRWHDPRMGFEEMSAGDERI